MTADTASKARPRILLQAVIGLLIVALFVAAGWYLRSPRFHAYVRARVIADLEDLTGGRVELGALHWDLGKLYVVGDNLTIHGLEAPNEAPYAHADRLAVRFKILSFAGRQLGLRSIELDHPVIHLIVYPDGHTNQPTPRAAQTAGPVQQVFDLQIDRLEVRNGLLLLNDRPMPLDLRADGVQAQMVHVSNARRYDGTISAAGIRTAYRELTPFEAAASAQFSLRENQLDLKQVRLSTGNSWVEAVGQVVDFRNPRLTLNYHGSFDVQRAGEIAHLPQFRRGVLEVNGSGTYAKEDFSTSGKLLMRGVEFLQSGLHLVDLDGGADFVADKHNAALPHLFARALQGTVVGSAEIKNWGGAPAPLKNVRHPQQEGILRLRLNGLSVAQLARAVSTPAVPLHRLNPVGAASGTVDLSWRGLPSQATVNFALTAAPPAQAAADQLPVTADVLGSYSAATQALEFLRLNLAGRSVALNASGAMAMRTNNLQFALNVGNLRDVNTLLAPLSPSQQLPQEMTGLASFTGTLHGRWSAPEIAGHLSLSDFTIPVPLRIPTALLGVQAVSALPSNAHAEPPHLAHFDSLAADVRYSPSILVLDNGQLRQGAAQAAFDLTTGLHKGKFDENSPITLRLGVRNFPVSELENLAGYTYPITGTANASLQVEGTAGSPRGGGHLNVTGVTIKGEPFQAVDADLQFADQELQANNLVMAHNGARITGTAAYNLKTTALRFELRGANFNLAQFRQLQFPRLPVGGLLNFEARGSGTTQAPVVNADLHVRDLTLNREVLGDLDATAFTTRGVMRLTARSHFPVAHLEVDGTVGMYADYPADLSLRMARLNIDPLLREFLHGRLTGHSSVVGTVLLKGPLRQPRLLNLTGDLSSFSVDIEHMRIQNDGPLRFSMTDQTVHFDQFRLAGDDTQLALTGTVALAGPAQMNLRGEGHVNLKLLQTWNPDLHSAGIVDFGVTVAGTPARPSLRGSVHITKAALTNINFPNGLNDINGTLVFNQDRMQIQTLTASSGGGSLRFTGFLTYGNGLAFDLSAMLKDVRLRYPQGMSTGVNADLRLTGTTGSATLAGQAVVTRFSTSPQFDLALAIARYKQPPENPNPNSPLNRLRLNVHIVSTPELQVQTSLAKVTGDIDVNLRGTATRPVLLGRINITEGQVNFNGTNYEVDRGDVTFTNPVRVEPVLDVEVTTRVQQYDITLGFHGPLDRLGTTYRSDPPLPTADIIALLAFGRTREEAALTTTAPSPSFTESASNAILGEALNAAVGNRVQRLFGVSRIKIAPEVVGAETNPNARVTIEQQVSKDFTVTYVTDLSRSAQQIIQIEYNYSRKYSIIASRDQFGVLAFDVRIRQRRK